MRPFTKALAAQDIHVGNNKVPVYIIPEAPFWFVPSPSAHDILSACRGLISTDQMAIVWHRISQKDILTSALDVRNLCNSITIPPCTPYEGRNKRSLRRLNELWVHITDSCNLRCKHCLFGRDLTGRRSLAPEKVLSTVAQAYALGCRVVLFTGGEPFVYPEVMALLGKILKYPDMTIAILTNGILVPSLLPQLQTLDRARVHLQVSLDGPETLHDQIRGIGTYRKTIHALTAIKDAGLPCSIAVAVNGNNLGSLDHVVKTAAHLGIGTVHLQWHLQRGLGSSIDIPPMGQLIPSLLHTCEIAEELGISIDNLEAMASQVFSPPGTRYDLGNACWESLAIGPDGAIYPAPAMVDSPHCIGGHVNEGLEQAWRNSKLFDAIRSISLTDSAQMKNDPWRFIIGGGDIDNSLTISQRPHLHLQIHSDPYGPVYRALATYLIEKQIQGLPVPSHPAVVLRMGDVSTDCPSGDDANFIHCNCLLSLGAGDMRGLVRQFYSHRAEKSDQKILNPIETQEDMDFIPAEARVRMYGCGSPVEDAELKQGETVLDLGSGSGVECFLASRMVGAEGMVLGLDMTQEMLDIARRSSIQVSRDLGYANITFLKGYLEEIPLADCTVDAVISNCVINLSKNKRKVFAEIFRVLRPGGRLVISDVVTETEPLPRIRADHQLIGECLGGAMVESYLFSLLRDMGFEGARVLKRFPYREVSGHQFYSLTFYATKSHGAERPRQVRSVMYSGPFRGLITEGSFVMEPGKKTTVTLEGWLTDQVLARQGVFALDGKTGTVSNVEMAPSCSCFEPQKPKPTKKTADTLRSYETGCLVCGEPIVYLKSPETRTCALCGSKNKADAVCAGGHFVCDLCHIKDPLDIIKRICTTSKETDMLALLKAIRKHKSIPVHGPEHHAMVPGIILATYKNLGGNIPEEAVITGIERGSLVPGGACGFMGSCGAAIGVGIAFSIILEANPLTPMPRKQVQTVVAHILQKIGGLKAARCCQRESCISLMEAAMISRSILPLELKALDKFACEQYALNKECIRQACALFPRGLDKAVHPPFPMIDNKI